MGKITNQKGQLVLTLVLVLTVVLAIGLSIVQRSLVDVSTSTKVEESSRAFSAAEAGIEKALINTPAVGSSDINFSENNSSATIFDSGEIPIVPTDNTTQLALEYPSLVKEDVAQFWLADFKNTSNPPPDHYKQTKLDVYWGNSIVERAALELTLIYYSGTQYVSKKWFLDHPFTRNPLNNFEQVSCTGYTLKGKTYTCKKIVDSLPPGGKMLLRARLLYNDTTTQPIAVQAVGTCGKDCSLPPQARNIISTGASGQTQRRVKLFGENNVVPSLFDYAIFASGEIAK